VPCLRTAAGLSQKDRPLSEPFFHPGVSGKIRGAVSGMRKLRAPAMCGKAGGRGLPEKVRSVRQNFGKTVFILPVLRQTGVNGARRAGKVQSWV